MPYYVYKINEGVSAVVKNIEYLADFEGYRDAKQLAKARRIEQSESGDGNATFKIIFAANKLDAEEKLMEVREAPIVKEWEK